LSLASGTLECSAPLDLAPAQAKGKALYGRMCAVCHGRNGDGYAADYAPALSNGEFLASVTDDYLRMVISSGRGGTTMSAWGNLRGGPLVSADVDAVVSYLRTWDLRPRASLDERPRTGSAVRGADIYALACARCHGAHGTEGPNIHIGNPELLANAGDGFLRHAIRHGRAGTAMPGFQVSLGDAAIEDVLALLRDSQAKNTLAMRAHPARPPPLPLGPVPLNPGGPEPEGFNAFPGLTKVDVVKAQVDRGARMALLDARAPSDYLSEHIAGAVSVPFYDPEPYVASLPRDAWLVCYCACPHAESGQLAQKLVTQGFTKVTVLDEGLFVWRTKNYGTHTGIDP
jgi:cytochrome c oxidase cbb3-type subunit 3/ubiquinol-cytochrome c reductase cytochrome c subunit